MEGYKEEYKMAESVTLNTPRYLYIAVANVGPIEFEPFLISVRLGDHLAYEDPEKCGNKNNKPELYREHKWYGTRKAIAFEREDLGPEPPGGLSIYPILVNPTNECNSEIDIAVSCKGLPGSARTTLSITVTR